MRDETRVDDAEDLRESAKMRRKCPYATFKYSPETLFRRIGSACTDASTADAMAKTTRGNCVLSFAGLLTAINCYNVKWATRVQDIFTATKILALVIIMVAGFYWLCLGHTENFKYPMAGTNTEPGYVALAIYSGLFSYSGWNYLNFVTEELKEPYK